MNVSALPQFLTNGILNGAIYALIALGYTMVYGVLRLINFAHGEVYMLGAYAALLTSYALGYGPGSQGPGFPPLASLAIMLLISMSVCAFIGILIERFAYRPMRNQPRIASLITAIGVSLLFQFGGQLLLPVSPPPSINEKVNPWRDPVTITLKGPSAELSALAKTLEPAYLEAKTAWDAQKKLEPNEFDLSPKGKELRTEYQSKERAFGDAKRKAEGSSNRIIVPTGKLFMFGTSIVLMVILWWLVTRTTAGRAMRAVSHDFDSASLMGINVNRTITLTFVIGSALAGAAAMMLSTFQGTPLTTFYGVQPGVKAFVAAVLGGIGNIPGAVVGGLLMGVAEDLVIWAGKSEYKDAVALVILIVVLLFRPGGILGSSKVEKV
jgi:branched-chain amino acid transport system permease protein